MRRRYGIPDQDQRPFNVAYAAARLAQDDSRKMQDRRRNVPTFDQPNPLGHGQTGAGIVVHIRFISTVVTDRQGKVMTWLLIQFRPPLRFKSLGLTRMPNRCMYPLLKFYSDLSLF